MNKEKSVNLFKDPDAIRKLESLKYVFRGPQNPTESGDHITYEWLEDSVIRKKASVEIGKDPTGKDSATIKMINRETKKEETIYYTADEDEVARLRGLSEGKTLVLEVSDKTLKNKIED